MPSALTFGEYTAVSIALILLLAIAVNIWRDRTILWTHTAIIASCIVLFLVPKLSEFTFSLDKDGFEATAKVAEIKAENDGLTKRVASLEAALTNPAGRQDSTTANEPRNGDQQPSILGKTLQPKQIDGKPYYDYRVVVLYRSNQEEAGKLIAKGISQEGYGVGDGADDFSSVKNKKPVNTVRIIYDRDKRPAAKDIEEDRQKKSFRTIKLNLNVAFEPNGFNVRNGDVQLQIF